MAYIEQTDLKTLYTQSKSEAREWREDYPAYERLADNDLLPGLDPNLPEVNDGSLAAALFKLPKRIVSSRLSGRVKALDRDEAWVGELANIVWEKEIIPHANTQAPFTRKWKDAVRKAAIYGSVPLVTIFVETNGKRHADFIVAQPQDVTLEPGKVSDSDSDLLFWDIYYNKTQLRSMIEQAEAENKEAKESKQDGYNKWDVKALKEILKAGQDDEERDSEDTPNQFEDRGNVKPKGFHFCMAVQRGVDAPYYMYHKTTDTTVREWTNPDPTGDTSIHFLYCYQDLINPYGIGIVKLAGGTQNVLDYMRQADVLATQIGLRPPIMVGGNDEDADIDSFVYTQDAIWYKGQAEVERMELSTNIYGMLPERMAMYKTSLNQLIPTGDTSISAGSGDPQYSKTPAGVKFQAASLSIDDEDFKDNLYMTYEAVAKSMINTHFANMEGADLLKLSDDDRERLVGAGFEWPTDETGEMSNQLEVVWDTVRANFDFTVDPDQDKAKEDSDKLEGLLRVAELITTDPTIVQKIEVNRKRLNEGELYAEIITLTTDNDKIITDIGDDEENEVDEMGNPVQPMPIDPTQPQQGPDPMMELNMQDKQMDMQRKQELHEAKMLKMTQPTPSGTGNQVEPEMTEEMQANIQAVMQEFRVDENTAMTALAAEEQGFSPEEIIAQLRKEQMINE